MSDAKCLRTSFYSLTGDFSSGNETSISRIEIPMFQRDYAQGRNSKAVDRIRSKFLEALKQAIADSEGPAVGLDFIYGGVEKGILQPLDGQQRLTTLFLLHWYIASRSGRLGDESGWKRFSYSTRQSARLFCERLVAHELPEEALPSEWIRDQPWYLFVWRHDPTVQSMLVMLDEIHAAFGDVDSHHAWSRLTDKDNPAVWFLLLPLSGLGTDPTKDMRPEDLYIKMNSRGRPLTEFENFKAHFQSTIAWSEQAEEFSKKTDADWSDLLWHMRGDDGVIDDEFIRYFDFITEVCEWHDGRNSEVDGRNSGEAGNRLDERAREIFGAENPNRQRHLDFLFKAFDVWTEHETSSVFERIFYGGTGGHQNGQKVRLFFNSSSDDAAELDLFYACCQSFGELRGSKGRVFTLAQTVLLFAMIVHLSESTEHFCQRVRVLRNLVEASTNELRPDRMPSILTEVERYVREGDLSVIETLNQAQKADEVEKAQFLTTHPDLREAMYALEDHELLRGSITAFELAADGFERRASCFERLMSQADEWPRLLGALLAVGEYQRQRSNSRPFLFGTDSQRHDAAWRELLTGPSRNKMQTTRRVLCEFLDRMGGTEPVGMTAAMDAIVDEYLAACGARQQFDWRYYMVKYWRMRGDGSSTYYAERDPNMDRLTMGYSLCMLRAGRPQLHGYYSDPYLLAIKYEVENPELIREPNRFSGYETAARVMRLTRSGIGIRCVSIGFELWPPEDEPDDPRFLAACAELRCDENRRMPVHQTEVGGMMIDSEDRIVRGTAIVSRLLEAGL